jgi:hypothetical protein
MIGDHPLIESKPNSNERKHCANGRKHSMNEQQKPVGLLVATAGTLTRETRLCLEKDFDGQRKDRTVSPRRLEVDLTEAFAPTTNWCALESPGGTHRADL